MQLTRTGRSQSLHFFKLTIFIKMQWVSSFSIIIMYLLNLFRELTSTCIVYSSIPLPNQRCFPNAAIPIPPPLTLPIAAPQFSVPLSTQTQSNLLLHLPSNTSLGLSIPWSFPCIHVPGGLVPPLPAVTDQGSGWELSEGKQAASTAPRISSYFWHWRSKADTDTQRFLTAVNLPT